MGATHSSAVDEKIFPRNNTSALPSNRLADNVSSPATTQSMLDAHIKARIQDELERLKREEEYVQQEVERALERENLDREKSMAGKTLEGDEATIGNIKNSVALLGDLKELGTKVEGYHAKGNASEFPEIGASSFALVECYRRNKETSLNCWQEVSRFKTAVEDLEQKHFRTLDST